LGTLEKFFLAKVVMAPQWLKITGFVRRGVFTGSRVEISIGGSKNECKDSVEKIWK